MRRKKTERPRWKIAPAAAFIDEVFAADRKVQRKQRHTARRIWERVVVEVPGCTAAERTVRDQFGTVSLLIDSTRCIK